MAETSLYSPIVAFALTGLIEFVFIAKFNFRYIAGVKEVQRLYAKEGKSWDYWSDIRLRLTMFRNADALFDAADSPEVRAAKEELLKTRLKMRKFLPIGLAIMVGGFFLCCACAIIESLIRSW